MSDKKIRATYADGSVIDRKYIAPYGMKLNGSRPMLIEIWGGTPEEVRQFRHTAHPCGGKVVSYE